MVGWFGKSLGGMGGGTYLGSAVPFLNHDTQKSKLTKAHKFSFPFTFLLLQSPKMILLFPLVLSSHIVLFFFDPLASVGQGRGMETYGKMKQTAICVCTDPKNQYKHRPVKLVCIHWQLSKY